MVLLPGRGRAGVGEALLGLHIVGQHDRGSRPIRPEPWEAYGGDTELQERIDKRDLHEIGTGALEWPRREVRGSLVANQQPPQQDLHRARDKTLHAVEERQGRGWQAARLDVVSPALEGQQLIPGARVTRSQPTSALLELLPAALAPAPQLCACAVAQR
jgi:hypothetical protein